MNSLVASTAGSGGRSRQALVDACGYQFEDTVYLAAREAADAPQEARMDGFVALVVIGALAIIALGGVYSAWCHH